MGLFNFGFGFGKKRRRSTRRKSSKRSGSRKMMAKPPARLLKICKKYHVKATKKVGKKRVYKSISSLKKMCLKKAMALRKKLMKKCKSGAKRRSPMHRRRRVRRSGFGGMMKPGMSAFGKEFKPFVPGFGKRRAGSKTSRKAAMKAFRSFYKRHCAGRRSRFGSGGNPPLYQSMGGEFCPNGMGGVTGATSTGLFATPCVGNMGAGAPGSYDTPSTTGDVVAEAEARAEEQGYALSYGRRRKHAKSRRSTKSMYFGRRKSRKSMSFGRRKSTAIGVRLRRRSTATGVRRRRRSTAIGARRRRRSTATGVRRRRRSTKSMSFGRRRGYCRPRAAKRRVKGSAPCGGLKRNVCKSTAGCSYVSTRKRYGCKRKGGRRSGSSGSLISRPGSSDEGYAINQARENIPGWVLFGRRRRSRRRYMM